MRSFPLRVGSLHAPATVDALVAEIVDSVVAWRMASSSSLCMCMSRRLHVVNLRLSFKMLLAGFKMLRVVASGQIWFQIGPI